MSSNSSHRTSTFSTWRLIIVYLVGLLILAVLLVGLLPKHTQKISG